MLLSKAKKVFFRKPKASVLAGEAYQGRNSLCNDEFGLGLRHSRKLRHEARQMKFISSSDGSWSQNAINPSQTYCSRVNLLYSGGLGFQTTRKISEESYPKKKIVCTYGLGSDFSRKLSSVARCMKDECVLPQEVSSGGLLYPTNAVSQSIRHYLRCYWDLSKARLSVSKLPLKFELESSPKLVSSSMLVVTTAGAGYVMGSGVAINYCGLSWTCLGTFCVAAAANTFNQILEVENDSKMKRTKRRPLPSGCITTEHAIAWGLTTGIGGIALLASQANMIAAGLGAINLILYTLVYTPLKQINPVNTWVGAVVGAVPPLLGWAAAAGEVSMGGWLLASVLYFWQIPHFMAIAYMCREDYAAGGFKMLSMEDVSGRRTALVALRNCGYLAPLGYLAYQSGMTSEWFGLETALLSAGMGTSAALFYFKPSNDRARKLFRASLLYLPFVMVGMLSHRHPNVAESDLDEGLTMNGEMITSNIQAHKVLLDSQQISRPPVAYFSVAPFPFLPLPDFTPS